MATEEWALAMIPRPVKAVLMLYPIKDAGETYRHEEADRIREAGQTVDPKLYYSKQTIGAQRGGRAARPGVEASCSAALRTELTRDRRQPRLHRVQCWLHANAMLRLSALTSVHPAAGNACGTIGILHAVANLSTYTGGEVALAPDSFFDKFVKATLEATPEERAEALEKDDSIDESHAAVAQQGQSEVVDDTYNHFIAFVAKGGHLYEMDGRKEFPINHGPTSEETLLEVRDRLQYSCRCRRKACRACVAAESQRICTHWPAQPLSPARCVRTRAPCRTP